MKLKLVPLIISFLIHSSYSWAQNPPAVPPAAVPTAPAPAPAVAPTTYPPAGPASPAVPAPAAAQSAPAAPVVQPQTIPAAQPQPAAPPQIPATYPPATYPPATYPPVIQQQPRTTTTLAPRPRSTTTTTLAPLERVEKKKDPNDLETADMFEYPELQVVPRATERLQMESARENDWSSSHLWTYYTSGLMTYFAAGVHAGAVETGAPASKVSESANVTKMAQLVGLGTVGTALYFSLSKPASSSIEKLKYVKATGKRGALQKERMAEESLEDTANKIRKFSWMSAVVNLGANAAVFTFAQDNNTRMYTILGSVIAFFPVMFESSYIAAYEKQIEYKRKIYAPLPTAYYNPHPTNPQWGINLTWRY